MEIDPNSAHRWSGPGGLRIEVVPLTGVHRIFADAAGVPPEVVATVLVTKGGAIVGRGYYSSMEELAVDVDLSQLVPG